MFNTKAKPDYQTVNHGSSVVVATSGPELHCILKWCDEAGKHVSDFMRSVQSFPYCLSVSGDVVGWTDQMDRALYYMPFAEFVAETTNQDA